MMMVASFCHFVLSRRNKATKKKTKNETTAATRKKKIPKDAMRKSSFCVASFRVAFFPRLFAMILFSVFSYGAFFVSIHGVLSSQKDTMAQISHHNIIYSGLFWLVLEHFGLCVHICALKNGMY